MVPVGESNSRLSWTARNLLIFCNAQNAKMASSASFGYAEPVKPGADFVK
jgi:hypothetical protein